MRWKVQRSRLGQSFSLCWESASRGGEVVQKELSSMLVLINKLQEITVQLNLPHIAVFSHLSAKSHLPTFLLIRHTCTCSSHQPQYLNPRFTVTPTEFGFQPVTNQSLRWISCHYDLLVSVSGNQPHLE